MNSITQNRYEYQRRLNSIRYLDLNEVKKLVLEYYSNVEANEPPKVFIKDPLKLVLNFYYHINKTWYEMIKKFVRTPNFKCLDGLAKEDCGTFFCSDYECIRILVGNNNDIEDVFILVHEFGHLIAYIYELYSNRSSCEVFPILMEYQLACFYGKDNKKFKEFFEERLKTFNHTYASAILDEIEFIEKNTHNKILKEELTSEDYEKMEEFLSGYSLEVRFSYLVGEYYLKDYQELEKRKELHKNL